MDQISEPCVIIDSRGGRARLYLDKVFPLKLLILYEGNNEVFTLHRRLLLALLHLRGSERHLDARTLHDVRDGNSRNRVFGFEQLLIQDVVL